MLEDFFVVPAAARRVRSCALGAHLDAFCARLSGLGYPPATIRYKLWVVETLARSMTAAHVAVADLDDGYVREFVAARRRRGRTWWGFRKTVSQLTEQLRTTGVLRASEPARESTPAAALLARYEEYLRQERALSESTLTRHRPFVQGFIAERCCSTDVARLDRVGVQDVREFLLGRIRRLAPSSGLSMGTALRSFLRFLFLHGETGMDLSLAVPTVRQWRLSTVPKYMAAQDVERLLRSCDRSSITGRRDRAILLLLARLGLRAGEIVALEIGDLRWREGEIIVRGKGLVRDRLPLLPDVGEALARYLRKGRPPGNSRRVFLCRQAPYRVFSSHQAVSSIVRRALARAGLAPAKRGAHLLRHSLATGMLRRGASLAEIGQVLRHRSRNTTEIYSKVDFGALRSVTLPWPTTGRAR